MLVLLVLPLSLVPLLVLPLAASGSDAVLQQSIVQHRASQLLIVARV